MTLKNKSGTFLLEVADMGFPRYHLKKLQSNQSKKREIIIIIRITGKTIRIYLKVNS